MENQDWEDKIFRKPIKPATKVQPPSASQINKVSNFDPDSITAPTQSTLPLGSAIQQARTSKQMTQADLDKACSFPRNTVRKYESNETVYNAAEVNKMAGVLGVTLPRPQKPKKPVE